MSHRDIKEMAGSDTRRILVVILGSRSRYLYEIRFELIPRARRRETYGGRCSDTITGKPGLELLVRCKPAPGDVDISAIRDRYCTRHQPTVITQLTPTHGPFFHGWYCTWVVWLNFSSLSMRNGVMSVPIVPGGTASAPPSCGVKNRAATLEKMNSADNP